MCARWTLANKPGSNAICTELVNFMNGQAEDNGFDMMTDFSCDTVGSNYVRVCGEFNSQEDATSYFEIIEAIPASELALALPDFVSVYVNNVCTVSSITITQSFRGGSICNTYTVAAQCADITPGFPHPRCPGYNQVGPNSPYSISYDGSTEHNGDVVVCLDISVDTTTTGRCSDMGLDKIEILSRPECQSSVDKYWTSRNPSAKMSPAWRRQGLESTPFGDNLASLAFNRLGLNEGNADGVQVCFSLKSTEECPDIESLCYSGSNDGTTYCRFATFDEPGGCCASDVYAF